VDTLARIMMRTTSVPAALVVPERLEARRLFAVSLANGILAIDGTDAADAITLSSRGSKLTVRVNSDVQTFKTADVDTIMINALGGDDRISLGRVRIDSIIDGGDGNDRILGGRGDDVITGGNGDDLIRGGDGNDALAGGAGNDRLYGDNGDDDLAGGDGSDLLAGGLGNDTSDATTDIVTGVEDSGESPGATGVLGTSMGSAFATSGFAGVFQNVPVDTTGFLVSPGTDRINPDLSAINTNLTTFNPDTGVTVSSGGVFVNLPNTGAFNRSFGTTSGAIQVRGWFTKD
jgi:Ca2+-binding RTX toxin-like protein